jgi:hypothetical protein
MTKARLVKAHHGRAGRDKVGNSTERRGPALRHRASPGTTPLGKLGRPGQRKAGSGLHHRDIRLRDTPPAVKHQPSRIPRPARRRRVQGRLLRGRLARPEDGKAALQLMDNRAVDSQVRRSKWVRAVTSRVGRGRAGIRKALRDRALWAIRRGLVRRVERRGGWGRGRRGRFRRVGHSRFAGRAGLRLGTLHMGQCPRSRRRRR